ncbi:MAG TPA: hypothetical protein VKN76_07060 [Kiloniellaceae bacterium]|nr:hypothetical protein [Kiloniellaceae bacterium]
MQVSVHRISRYAVQVLTRKRGEKAHSFITVRLYDEDEVLRGTAVFENLGGGEPNKPTGDYDAQTATIYFDSALYSVYVDLLRHEKSLYLKMSWTAQGASQALSHASIDTKKEIIGEYFS